MERIYDLNGGVWFNGENLKIISIWQNEIEELPQDFPKWDIIVC